VSDRYGSVHHDALVRIHSTVVGTGRPLVLVHGWGATAQRNWVDLGWVEAPEPIRRLILMDARGHGPSDPATTQAGYGYAAMS
jgi:pimeloyl-ACP methyl ester carboxylesterase